MADKISKRMTCSECGNVVWNEQSFCEKCGNALDWYSYVEPAQEPQGIRCGTINCSCGQSFYFETVQTKVNCIKCNKEYDVSTFPFKDNIVEVVTEEQVQVEEA